MSTAAPIRESRFAWKSLLSVMLLATLGVGAGVYFFVLFATPERPRQPPRMLANGGQLSVWWDELPASIRQKSAPPANDSNIHPADYAGPDSCQKCHPGNYDQWAKHPHRWMNALASDETVRGDFSGATMTYRGGTATFERSGKQYRMRLERGDSRRAYAITQTIGSRFYQYYVGTQLEGPEPAGHRFYTEQHVLPLGYWLTEKTWVPVVHIGPEEPDERRPDPFAPPDQGRHYAEYAVGCNHCHTTIALADQMTRNTGVIGAHAPWPLHWSLRPYLEKTRPEKLAVVEQEMRQPSGRNPLARLNASDHAVTLGVSCEACHLGAKAHVASGGKALPRFLPASPQLTVETTTIRVDAGRTHDNVNWACGRCHTGSRPKFAAGMSTWNSVEYADAMLGSCYSQLKCIDCHNPHRALGPKWSLSGDHDDALCLKCHESLRPADLRAKHTHHSTGSEGARCMNCHMPRINEGIQDVVRTHMIYSPTRADMIEANHPNACNLCHTDKPIDWTLGHLKNWYGKAYDGAKIAAAYRKRETPVGHGWMQSDNPAVRLVGAEALLRAKDSEALPLLFAALDDPHLLNRQFAVKGIHEFLNVRPEEFGYRFYMSKDERHGPLQKLRKFVEKQTVGSVR